MSQKDIRRIEELTAEEREELRQRQANERAQRLANRRPANLVTTIRSFVRTTPKPRSKSRSRSEPRQRNNMSGSADANAPSAGAGQSNPNDQSRYEDSLAIPADSIIPEELLSTVYRIHAGKIPDRILKTYSEAYAKLFASGVDLAPYRRILADYAETRRKIDDDRTKVTITICPMDEALTRLEKCSIKTIKLNELVIRPEIFDGDTPQPRRWLLEYEEAIIANGWDDYIAIKYLPTFLRKDAKDWYMTEIKSVILNRDPSIPFNPKWAYVHEAFCLNYTSEGDYEKLRREIDRAMQKPNELACSYVPRMRRLLLLLDPRMTEGEQVRQLKLKLRPDLKKLIAICDPQTIGALKEAMIKIESTSAKEPGQEEEAEQAGGEPKAQEQGNPGRKPRRESRRREAPMRSQQLSHSPEQQSQPQRLDSPQRARMSHVVTCYCCGKLGHYSYECRSKLQGERQTSIESRRNPARTVNTVNTLYGDGETKPHQVLTVRTAQPLKAERKPRFSISEIEYINLLVGGGKLLRQKVLCNEVEVNAVVDTGAYVSVMDEDIVKRFKWKIDGVGTPLAGADGNSLVSKGSTLVQVILQIGKVKKSKEHRVVVVKDLATPMLLGLELLREFKICIDIANMKLVFVSNDEKAGIGTCCEEITPPQSKTIIEDRVNTVGLVLPAPSQTENGLAMANSIAEMEDNSTPIVILDSTVTGDKLGKFTQLSGAEQANEESSSSSFYGEEGAKMTESLMKVELEEPIFTNMQLS